MAERRQVVIDLVTKTGGSTQGLKKLKDQFGGVQTSSVKAGDGVKGFGKKAGGLSGSLGAIGIAGGLAVGGLAALAGVLKGSVSAFSDFDDKLNQSLAIMGDVSTAMRNDMSDAARDLATQTRFSAAEAADSYFFLASAGLDAEQAIAALPSVAMFAQAGMFDMSLATDLLTDAQSALGLTVDDSADNLTNMTRVSDVFVAANTLANTSVQEVSEAITNKLGGALRTYNIELEEGVAVLAAYADQGLKGATAGEAFNIVLRDLKTAAIENAEDFAAAGIAVFDAEGNFRNMADVVGDLTGAFEGLSVEQQTQVANDLGFQDRSFKNIQLLFGQSEAIREYETDLRSAGGITQEVADKQMASFAAQMDITKSRVTDLGISLGQSLAPAVLTVAELALDLLEVFDDAARAAKDFDAALETVNRRLTDATIPRVEIYEEALKGLISTGALTVERMNALAEASGITGINMIDATAAAVDFAREATEVANASQEVRLGLDKIDAGFAGFGHQQEVTTEKLRLLEAGLYDQILALDLSWDETQVLVVENGLLAEQWARAAEASVEMKGRTEELTGAESDLEGQTGETTGEVLTLEEALDAAADAQASLADVMRAAVDPTFAVVQAIEALQEAELALIEVENDVEASAEDVAGAQLDFLKATLEAQGALDAFDAGGIEQQIGVISSVLGISDDAARDLLATLGVLDGKQVRTVITTEHRSVFTQQGSARQEVDALARQHGGPVSGGSPYLVGEAGPEVFVPDQSGSVISNENVTNLIAALRSAGTQTQMTGELTGRLAAPINIDGRQVAEAIIDYEASLR